MAKRVAILQSNYIPWKGYFDLIAAVDEFVLYDDMQYTKNDWRNRNLVKTPTGTQWMTVPIVRSSFQPIRDVEIRGTDWAQVHWKTLVQNYAKAEFFDEVAVWLEPIYLQEPHTHLSALNRRLIEAVSAYLGIATKLTNSWDYVLTGERSERVADLVVQAGGTEYVSGPAAKNYLDESVFAERDLSLTWFDYDGYPTYPQLWGEFSHAVTILDLLFNCGPKSPTYMRWVRR